MRNSKRFVGFSLLVFCLAISLGQRDVFALCSSGEVVNSTGCGCSGWITYQWNPNQDCTGGGYEEDKLCAQAVCNVACSAPLHLGSYEGCNSNQYGSWLGFKCGHDCS